MSRMSTHGGRSRPMDPRMSLLGHDFSEVPDDVITATADHDHDHDHHGSRCYNVTLDFCSLVLAIGAIGLVLYLSGAHFSHQMDLIALAMLLPIVLNFVGVTYYLSDKDERMALEKHGPSKCLKDIFQVPILGPVFTSAKVLLIAIGISTEGVNYARFEASAIKMKQAESFFSAAPEALVQLTVLLVSRGETLTVDNYLEMVVVIMCTFTLTETNMYGMLSNYFKMFHEYECEDWRLPHISFPKKLILFFHTLTSIISRLAATAFLKSALKYWLLPDPPRGSATPIPDFPDEEESPPTMSQAGHGAENSEMATQLAKVLVWCFLAEIGCRMVLFYIARFLKHLILKRGIPSGCYEAVNYGWRATILDFGFQSKNTLVQIWFYLENSLYFIFWWIAVKKQAPRWVLKEPFPVIAAIFIVSSIASLFLLFAAVGTGLHRLQSPFHKSRREEYVEK